MIVEVEAKVLMKSKFRTIFVCSSILVATAYTFTVLFTAGKMVNHGHLYCFKKSHTPDRLLPWSIEGTLSNQDLQHSL